MEKKGEGRKERDEGEREDTNTKIPTGGGDRNGDFEDIKRLTILSSLHTHVGTSNTNISHMRIKH